MCGIVVATEDYGQICVPGWFREAVNRWVDSADLPAGVTVWITKEKGMVIDIRPPGQAAVPPDLSKTRRFRRPAKKRPTGEPS